MKRLIAVFLIFVLVIPVVAITAQGESDLIGIWIQSRKKDMATWCIYTLQINNNNFAFYSAQYYTKEIPVETDMHVLSWSVDGKKIVFCDNDAEFMTLYSIDKYHLSSDPRGSYGIYSKTPSNEHEYEEEQISNNVSEIDYNPVGCWALPHNYSSLKDNYVLTTTYLFLAGNGSAYRMSFGLKKGNVNLSISNDNGIWIGDRNDMTIRLSDDTYKAHIDDAGNLMVEADVSSIEFHRVNQ